MNGGGTAAIKTQGCCSFARSEKNCEMAATGWLMPGPRLAFHRRCFLREFIPRGLQSQAEAERCDARTPPRPKGLIVRRLPGYQTPNALRITVGMKARIGRRVGNMRSEQFKGRLNMPR